MSDKSSPESHPAGMADLRPKMKLKGTVKQIELFGALVDIGVNHDGLLHISQLPRESNEKVEDLLNVGDQITVWVSKVDKKAGRIDLTMLEPLATEWRELKVGQTRTGKVVRLENYGAFVDIGAERPGLVHVRELTHGYVSHPSEVISIGDEVDVQVIAVNRRKRQIDLSMKALETQVEEVEEEAPVLTAMELAFRSAMQAADEQATQSKRQRKKKKKGTVDREDIFKRTLEQHRE